MIIARGEACIGKHTHAAQHHIFWTSVGVYDSLAMSRYATQPVPLINTNTLYTLKHAHTCTSTPTHSHSHAERVKESKRDIEELTRKHSHCKPTQVCMCAILLSAMVEMFMSNHTAMPAYAVWHILDRQRISSAVWQPVCGCQHKCNNTMCACWGVPVCRWHFTAGSHTMRLAIRGRQHWEMRSSTTAQLHR